MSGWAIVSVFVSPTEIESEFESACETVFATGSDWKSLFGSYSVTVTATGCATEFESV